MSKLEKIKTQIDFLKSILFTLVVSLFGMLSYIVVNLEKISFGQAIITIIGIVVDLILLFIAIKYTLRKIDELEGL